MVIEISAVIGRPMAMAMAFAPLTARSFWPCDMLHGRMRPSPRHCSALDRMAGKGRCKSPLPALPRSRAVAQYAAAMHGARVEES